MARLAENCDFFILDQCLHWQLHLAESLSTLPKDKQNWGYLGAMGLIGFLIMSVSYLAFSQAGMFLINKMSSPVLSFLSRLKPVGLTMLSNTFS